MIATRKRIILLICVMVVLALAGCRGNAPEAKGGPISKSSFLLGTYVEIAIYDQQDASIIDKAFDRIAEIERKMTINNAETSEIITLNKESGKNTVQLSPDTFYVLERGKYYSEISGGRFDITIGPIVKLWNIGFDNPAIPDIDRLVEVMRLVDYNKLELNKSDYTAKLLLPGMQADLGAIAKGYAADEAGRILRENGVSHAIINLGGNILALGSNVNGKPWRIGIQDPYNPRGDYMGIAQLSDKTVVTSGTYEKTFEQNGQIYHHILDPKTGYPADNEVISVSIITDISTDGDGLSTTCLLLGLEEGMRFIEELDGVEAVFVTYDKQVYVTSGMKDYFQIVDGAYKKMN